MNVSVLIPTRARADKLEACIRALSEQDWLPGDEIVVGLRWSRPNVGLARHGARSTRACARFRVIERPREGYIALRSALLPELKRRCTHLDERRCCSRRRLCPRTPLSELARAGRQRRGSSVTHPSAADRDADTSSTGWFRETSWVFFYDTMLGVSDRAHDFGFRHLFGLNFSAEARTPFEAALGRVHRYAEHLRLVTTSSSGTGSRRHAACRSASCARGVRLARPQLHDRGAPALARARARRVRRVTTRRACPEFSRDVFGRDMLDTGFLTENAEQIELRTPNPANRLLSRVSVAQRAAFDARADRCDVSSVFARSRSTAGVRG